ncbi:nucleoside triphosphate pyrophosphohydrolase [Natranaerobius trueperi]|uniref:Nucleoside triphosphate pyrophosphohydrolase n=2 Tax=Natranaerobius trueperi TaxID=759412 RepID=A0A226BVB8_9FIRM|nr:nucleoside triphosphate pyrophosphohydrolase [Natranaerobius trueperi]
MNSSDGVEIYTAEPKEQELSLLPLKKIMECLRSSKGCQFDKKQTHNTLKPYLLEECYEVIDAIENSTPEDLTEELGDLLLQVIFHTQIGEEQGELTLNEVLKNLEKKLIRRHPHVFTGPYSKKNDIPTWEEIKQKEKNNKDKQKSIMDGIPQGASALFKAEKVQKKASECGFDWEASLGAYEKVKEELQELYDAYLDGYWENIEEELGDVFFSLVNLARFMNVSSEVALEKTVSKFIRRFIYIEQKITEKNDKIENFSLKELDDYWEEAKKRGV